MPEVSVAELAAYQEGMSDQQKVMFLTQYSSDKKDRTIAIVLSILLGYLGIDRFYAGDIGLGILKLVTGGLLGIMYIVDWFLIMARIDEHNRFKAQEIAATIKATS